jgi:p-aminobenzoyl-glutamate transporter AbgT
MLPYFIVLTIGWTLFFIVWYPIGIPFGLGT